MLCAVLILSSSTRTKLENREGKSSERYGITFIGGKVKELKMLSLKEKAQRGACVHPCVSSHEWHVGVNRSTCSRFLTTKYVKVN